MTRPTCDECPRPANELCEHGNPNCGDCECTCESGFSLSVDVAPDGTSTVAYTPPRPDAEDMRLVGLDLPGEGS